MLHQCEQIKRNIEIDKTLNNCKWWNAIRLNLDVEHNVENLILDLDTWMWCRKMIIESDVDFDLILNMIKYLTM